jgi:hypothetical protein
MSDLANFVSLHPYFKIHPGKIDEIKAMLPRFVAKTEPRITRISRIYKWNRKGNGSEALISVIRVISG